MPPYMDPRVTQGRSAVDYYSPNVHSSGMFIDPKLKNVLFWIIKNRIYLTRTLSSAGVNKPAVHDRLNSPGSASDECCHSSMHQERRALSADTYSVWSQDGYPPARSFTPPYQRQHDNAERCQSDDRYTDCFYFPVRIIIIIFSHILKQ